MYHRNVIHTYKSRCFLFMRLSLSCIGIDNFFFMFLIAIVIDAKHHTV